MERTNILVVTTKSWNITNFNKYKKDNWFLITEKHESVSYTHLDVYKRQDVDHMMICIRLF